MSSEGRPNKFVMPISGFDVKLLPENKRDKSSPDYGAWIQEYFIDELAGLGVNARIVVGPDTIEIDWGSSDVDLFQQATEMLEKGDYPQGVKILRMIRSLTPDSQGPLYNLGMALSDMGELDEAIQLLSRLVELAPDHANGLVSLGVAQTRHGQLEEGAATLAKACELEPDNPYAHRNMAGVLLKLGQTEKALGHLKNSTQLLPEDPAGWFGLGQALMEINEPAKADEAFRKVLAISPNSDIGEAARSMLTKLAEQTMRERGIGGDRPDAMMYCLAAMEKFEKLSDDQLKPVMLEIAMKGSNGFDINSPEKRYTFKTIDGDFSGLQAVSYMYVAMQRLMPGQDAGIDLSSEYEQAQSLFKQGH